MTDHQLLKAIREDLRAVLGELAALRRAVDAIPHAQPAGLRARDRRAMAQILPVLSAHFVGAFRVSDLIDLAGIDNALGVNLRLVIDTRNAHSLGHLFARCAGYEIDGITLHRVGRDADGAWWQCGDGMPSHRPIAKRCTRA